MTNQRYKRQTAVALAYGSGQTAPRVVAKGRGELAERIIDRAKESGVFVHESPELVNLLMQVDLDSNIPPELYQAVAEVLHLSIFLNDKPVMTVLYPLFLSCHPHHEEIPKHECWLYWSWYHGTPLRFEPT